MNIEYVIIQAGGQGTRMGHYTANRPKALVPVDNKPLIWNIFERFPDRKFVIIGDYKYDVLKQYLSVFCKEKYVLLQATQKGNAAGIKDALEFIPEGKSFAVVWCDLTLPEDICGRIETLGNGAYAVTTDEFTTSRTLEGHGVAGMYLFDEKGRLAQLPENGSFFGWLTENNTGLKSFLVEGIKEFGTEESIEKTKTDGVRSRPYNKIEIDYEKGIVTKTGLTPDAQKLLKRECAWYEAVQKNGSAVIPNIYSYEPLQMEYIDGTNVFCAELSKEEKEIALRNIVGSLKKLHAATEESIASDAFDMWEDYYSKTLKRLRSVAEAIPFADKPVIRINGKDRKNVLCYTDEFAKLCRQIMSDCREFTLIHGDNTLTNTLISRNGEIKYIDARGYFGHTELFGDPDYDWAKLYYSIEGNFDNFNIGKFKLDISDDGVDFKIESNGWEFLTDQLFELTGLTDEKQKKRIKVIHAIVWLSLASHCWEDYDSLCGAFYNGLDLLDL